MMPICEDCLREVDEFDSFRCRCGVRICYSCGKIYGDNCLCFMCELDDAAEAREDGEA